METCVLIPSEFSLVLCPNKDSKENHNSLERRKDDDNVNRLYEMSVCVWSNQYIPKGTFFLPFQGTIRLDRLEVHSLLMKNDIRYRFGCFDEIQQIDNQKVRHCNWIRFLRHLPSINSKVNLIGRLIHGEIIYETISNVRPNTEMIAFYDTKSIHESRYLSLYPSYFASTPVISSHHHAFICRQALQESPLDLSMSLVKSPASSSSSLSFSSLSSSTNQEKMSLTSDPSSLTLDLSKSSSLSSASSIASPSASLSPSSVKSVSSKGKTMIDNHEMSFKSDEKSTIGKTSPLLKLNGTASLQLNHKPSVTLASHNQTTNIIKKARERTMLPCEYCGKAFDRPSLLRRHLRTHTGEKPHVCDVCGKGFSTSSSLNTHRRIHTGEKPHQCNVCCKRFTASSNLYYHRMTHNKEKPHKCTLCSKSFPTPGDLKSHMYVHNGSWPFKCHICNRGFSKQTNLRNHMYLHTGDRPHECEKCPKKFALACNLRAHLKTHEDSNTSRCSKCGREYRSSSRLLTLDCCADCYQQNHGIPLLSTH